MLQSEVEVFCSELVYAVLLMRCVYLCSRGNSVSLETTVRGWILPPSFVNYAWVRLATDTFPQTPHTVEALCTGYALFLKSTGANIAQYLICYPSIDQ